MKRRGVTLIELLVVVAIFAVLAGLLLPAVHSARESARRANCANNLHQLGLSVLNYESARKSFPPGGSLLTGHSWGGLVLPYSEHAELYKQLDFEIAWDDPSHAPVVSLSLGLFQCPTSQKRFPGSTDYCGISGSALTRVPNVSSNGILFPIGPGDRPLRARNVKDGLTRTLLIAEGVNVDERNFGYWACGHHCFGHDEGPINNPEGTQNEINSHHHGGAQSAFADGAVKFLHESIDAKVIGAICTRAGHELLPETF
ncbi:MAG: DUF1559 domain-containing protein [Planctomycetota bacterium]